MHYYVDGYNLLFRTFGSGISDLKFHRKSLIDSLNVKIAGLRLNVTVVFDSQYLPGEGSRGHFQHLEICFTPAGMTADEYIIQEISSSQNPERETVVTSDKYLAIKARNCSAAAQSIEEFLSWLNKRHKNKGKLPKPASPLPFATPAPAIRIALEEASPAQPETQGKLPEEGSLDYYLLQFEKELAALKSSEKPSKASHHVKRKKKVIAEPTIEVAGLTEEERWLKIFLERLKT